MGPNIACFPGFCHHSLITMSAHMHAYHYPLSESGNENRFESNRFTYAEKIGYY